MRTKPYVTPPTSVTGGGVAANVIVVPPVTTPGPRTVIQPALAFVGSNSATYATAPGESATGAMKLKLNDVGNVTVTDGVIVTNAIVWNGFAPIADGRRRTLCTCGNAAGSAACNVAESVVTVLAGGTVMLPCKPPMTGANEIAAGPCGVAVVELVTTGGSVGEGDGVGATTDGGIDDEPPPPPHPTAVAANASNATECFIERHKPMSFGSGMHNARLVILIDHKYCAHACYSVILKISR